MKYGEWVMKNGHIDRLVRADMPTEQEVWRMTDDEIIEKYGHRIVKVADDLGIELDKHALYEIIDRLYGVPDIPFHRSHYDLHC
jgi:hypothetical protein